MSVASEVSYLRRFAGKFVEIVAAGIGTAVSGYLVAYVTGHLSWSDVTEHLSFSSRPAIEATSPQAVSSPARPQKNASIEATVRAALASHDVSRAAPVVATLPPAAPAAPESAAAPVIATLPPAAPIAPESAESGTPTFPAVPPLAAAEIKSLPVAAAVDSPLPAEPDAWPPSDPPAMSGTGRWPAAGSSKGLPPQPPPVNGNLFTAIERFF